MTDLEPSFEPPAEPDSVLGSIMESVRREAGQSLGDLTERTGVDESVLAQIEAGTFDPPWPMMEAIAHALSTSLEELGDRVVGSESLRLQG